MSNNIKKLLLAGTPSAISLDLESKRLPGPIANAIRDLIASSMLRPHGGKKPCEQTVLVEVSHADVPDFEIEIRVRRAEYCPGMPNFYVSTPKAADGRPLSMTGLTNAPATKAPPEPAAGRMATEDELRELAGDVARWDQELILPAEPQVNLELAEVPAAPDLDLRPPVLGNPKSEISPEDRQAPNPEPGSDPIGPEGPAGTDETVSSDL